MNEHENLYHDDAAIAALIAEGRHREAIGGAWDEIGALQVAFLRSQGLQPDQRLLDIGCGCLRGGVRFVRYLDAGHYFGLDISAALLEVGYNVELDDADRIRLPRTNLIADDDFDFARFGVAFDMALAQSVFTHVRLPSVRRCLERLAPVMAPGGRFYATFFELPADAPAEAPHVHASGIVTHGARDPYHYRPADLATAAGGLPWSPRSIGAWGHPKGQSMMEFTLRAGGHDPVRQLSENTS